MAEAVDYCSTELIKFEKCSAQLKKIVYQDSAEYQSNLSTLLDELNSLDYSLKFVRDEVVGKLLTQCTYLVTFKLELLVIKVCQLTFNLVSKQQMVLDTGLDAVTEYFLEALRLCPSWMFPDVLRALAVIVYENGCRLSKFHDVLIGPKGTLVSLISSKEDDVIRGSMQCIENLCIRPPNCTYAYLGTSYVQRCFDLFLRILQAPRPKQMDELIHCRMVVSGLRGIQSILLAMKSINQNQLGPLLASIKAYMLYGLPGTAAVVQPCLYPTPLSQYDPGPALPPKPTAEVTECDQTSTTAKPSARKNKRKRGKGKKAGSDDGKEAESKDPNPKADTVDRLEQLTLDSKELGNETNVKSESSSGFMLRSKLSSSESEFSDTEGAAGSRLRSYSFKVRQCTMGCFHALIRATDRRIMFSYWSSFVPDTPALGGPQKSPTLFTAIMKDPSPKARTLALAVLTAMLEGSKQFLMAAEELDQYRNAPFTPFSVTVGHMIKEIHRCLMLALVSETSPLAITQIIKCLATLVPNAPYQRLKPGLLTRIVKQIRPFLSHRDPNIRVACLTCFGSIVSIQPPMLEVVHILEGSRSVKLSLTEAVQTAALPESTSESGASASSATSGIPTPVLSSGARTPTVEGCGEVLWVVKLCVKNVASHLAETDVPRSPTKLAPARVGEFSVQPLPVRLESLQLLAQLTKGYFNLLREHLLLLRDVINFCLEDREPVVQLHGAKLLEELGTILLQQISGTSDKKLDANRVLEFWLPLLGGPLPAALQCREHQAVRSTVCDCLSNIGSSIFAVLPADKRVLCITLLLGLTSDDDHHVRAAAVRALGVYVLYTCLREDVNFIADAANSVITALEETNLNVRVKAAWSLGNLSDALVLNKLGGDQLFVEDFSDMLLLKLFEVAIRASHDNDKVKSNAVRALGNLLRYLPQRSFNSSRFTDITDSAINALVKNVTSSAMKVRWNACYATGNMFRNTLLPLGSATWTAKVHNSLTSVVKDCKNFKVRINAAMALSVPVERVFYGDINEFTTIFQSLVTALESAETVTDFAEYRYQDNLKDQVCSTLIHLMCLMEMGDLEKMASIMQSHQSTLQTHLDKYRNSGVEESSDSTETTPGNNLKDAEEHLQTLNDVTVLMPTQYQALCTIKELFTACHVQEDGKRPGSPTSTFIQSYD